MIKIYRKKPITVEAVQFDGSTTMKYACEAWIAGKSDAPKSDDIQTLDCSKTVVIQTLEGDMQASPGDYIIKGVCGEFYPCKPDIFKKTYEEVSDE